MRRSLGLILVLTSVFACKGKQHPAAFAGPITYDRIEKARSIVQLRNDWDDSLAAVEAEAGAPSKKTETSATWALADATSCAILTIERKGDHVSSISGGKRFNAADFVHQEGSLSTFEECQRDAKK